MGDSLPKCIARVVMKWETIRLIGEADASPIFLGEVQMKLEKYEDFKIVHVDLDYLKALHDVDNEVMYRDNTQYAKKPFLGILVTNDGKKYVIPFTSAKEKHKKWSDVNQSYYRIYEIIDTRSATYDSKDIIVDITNTSILSSKGIPKEEYQYYKKRILSIIEIRKMIPVVDGSYFLADLSLNPQLPKDERDWRILTYKEYQFCKNIKNGIIQRANKIYEKQMDTGKVFKFHCDYKKLESVACSYRTMT